MRCSGSCTSRVGLRFFLTGRVSTFEGLAVLSASFPPLLFCHRRAACLAAVATCVASAVVRCVSGRAFSTSVDLRLHQLLFDFAFDC
mmetsp:Transcript_36507/g.83541  ORF Transcript_36507/g.83541 Transcript_36507/m.83541 type:complete len:87 (-) Transcript_36507:6-266(-)